ncbi:putative pilus assembly protein FilE [Acinetobacter sp. ANC 4648]|uniref:putative pilus assembly protein FilE n=1 Tax=Acinetobacter sp. ANC 4648 TaxID=1977875 RepID=UPI000A3469AA|nr:putative pilus assembly protein FilE [Acinetobacter sp. ANC 4648]OTG79821.1 hypothetical protein B9T27_14175 [Acinetobacter sp. ANC 4648]
MFPKKLKVSMYTSCTLFLVGIASTVYAGGFYTIIGPDGHPMVVQQKKAVQKKVDEPKAISATEESQLSKIQNHTVQNAGVVQTRDLPSVTNSIYPDQFSLPKRSELKEDQVDLNPQTIELKKNVELLQDNMSTQQQSDKSQKEQSKQILAQKQSLTQILPSGEIPVLIQKTTTSESQSILESTKNTGSLESQYTIIDGVKYVNNEFLEDKEFNLEGKKRFYIMPSVVGGTSRFDTVEREKGLSRSFLDKLKNDKPIVNSPMILASTYYRLPKEEVVNTLEQTCFTDKKMTKAKSLTLNNREAGFWPVAPIKEKFVYEVVKIDPQVQDILFTSFASSQKTPSYYWPLVVFLDQKGCVIEGVSGFKNQEFAESDFQHAAIEGVLKKPQSAAYLFMTPLSSAIDVENKQLSNEGQIKLSVIR